MSIERIFYCDAPDPDTPEGRCPRHVRTAALNGRPGGGGVIFVTDPGGHSRTLHFCSWDCILKYAAKQEPMEVIPFHDE